MNVFRWVLIGAILILALVGVYRLAGGPAQTDAGAPSGPETAGASGASATPDTRVWRNEDCQACHPGVWKEWFDSWHRMAWVDPLFKARSNDYADTSCYDCHIPRNIPEVGFGPRTLPRASDKKSGIHCLSCHYDGQRIVSARENPTGDCQPRYAPELGTELACLGCHNQHGLHDEWKKTIYFQQGVGCNDCHMPVVKRPRGDRMVEGRHHGFHASRNRDPGPMSVRVTATGPGDTGGKAGVVQVAVKNEKIGHDFPADSRHRSADLVTRFLDPENKVVGEVRTERFHIPLRDALDQTRTTIPHGQTRSFRYPIPDGATQAEVALLYRLEKDDPTIEPYTLFEKTVRW
jgi:cytochrome c554/c'-like protein